MNYKSLNNFLAKSYTRFFPKTVNRKLLRKYNIFFVTTNKKILPKNFYPIVINLKEQIKLVENFNYKKKLVKFNTKMDLDKFLKRLFKNKSFNI